MRAVVLRAWGPPDVLREEEVAEPVPGPGQVVVEVEAAGVTWVETQVRAGRPPHPAMAPALPAVLGNGVGGRVVAAGPGAGRALVGRRVVASLGGTGGYAQRAAAPADGVVAVPGALGMGEAVALLADGRTAVGLVRAAAPRAGETVRVEAAAGGVGTLLVQIAATAGARVVAAARGERKLALARELGAHEAVDYGEEGWAARLGDGVDVVFDAVGGEVGRAAFERLRPGGRFVAYGMASGRWAGVSEADAARRGVVLAAGGRPDPAEAAERSGAALAEAAAGRLRAVVGQTFPLGGAAEAHAAMEARRTVGKTLLLPAAA